MPWGLDIFDEVRQIADRDRRRQLADVAARGIDADTAKNIGEIGKWFPWIPPGVTTALARAGFKPLSPEMQQIARDVTVATQRNTALGYRQPGDRVRTETFTQEELDAALGFVPKYMRENARRMGERALPTVNQRISQARQRVVEHGDPDIISKFDTLPLTEQAKFASFESDSDFELWKINSSARESGLGGRSFGEQWIRRNPITDNVLEPTIEAGFTGDTPVARGVRGAVRVGTTPLQAPVQMVQAQWRTFSEDVRQNGIAGALFDPEKPDPNNIFENPVAIASQTDIGQILGSISSGEDIDTGSGWFVAPDSGVAQERRAAEVLHGGTYANGQVRTIGRDFADVFYEPGSKEFNILSGVGDALVTIGVDRVSLDPLIDARRAARSFQSTDVVSHRPTQLGRAYDETIGLIRGGVRPTYDEGMRDAFIEGPQARRFAEWITKTDSISKIDAATGGNIPPELLLRWRDATDVDDVIDSLRGAAGTTLRSKPRGYRRGGLAFEAKELLPPRARRLFGSLPSTGMYDTYDPRRMVSDVESLLRTTQADTATVDRYMERMAAATDNLQRRTVMFDLAGEIAERGARDFGLDPEEAKKLTRYFDETEADARAYFRDLMGDDVNADGFMIDGQLVRTPTPMMLTELVDRYMPALDVRALRRQFSDPVTRAILAQGDGNLRRGWAVTLAAQEKIWKPAVLLRAAYVLRVVGEEQLRIATAGYQSLTKHPLGYLAYVLGDSPRVERMLQKYSPLDGGRGQIDVFAGLLDESDEFGTAMAFRRGGHSDEVRLKDYRNFRREEPGYAAALVDEWATIAADPIGQMVARIAGGFPHTAGAVAPPLPPGQLAIGTGSKNPLQQLQDMVWDGPLQVHRKRFAKAKNNPRLLSRAGSDEWVRQYLRRVNEKAGMDASIGRAANPAALYAMSTGRIDGVPIFTPGTPFHNPDAVKAAAKHADASPELVRGPKVIDISKFRQGLGHADDALNFLFDIIAAKPTNWLSRSPVFRQAYDGHIISFATKITDPEEQGKLIRWADDTNLSKADKNRLRSVMGTQPGDEAWSLATADQIAKMHALEDTKTLLYDLSERGQFFDTFRLIFPFGEAWKEMVTTWSRLVAENPKVPLTAKRVLEAGRNETVGDVLGAPEGQGFFYRDEYGVERFAYPLTAGAMGLLGLPEMPLTGRLAGLSLMTEVLPGVGPIMSLAAAALLPDTPEWDKVNDLIHPFGRPNKPLDPLTWANETMPPWLRSIVIGSQAGGITAEGQRQLANTTMDVMRHKVATGEYRIHDSANSKAEVERLIADSKREAAWMTVIRGFAQGTAPSSPAFEWYIDTPDGRKLPMLTLVEHYRELQQEDFATATQRFLDLYGDNAFLLMQGKSMTISPGIVAPTNEANDWLRANPWAQKAYPTTYGFFAPQGGDFNGDAYRRQLEMGERNPLSPEMFVKAGNDMIGKSIYYAARERAMKAAEANGRASLTDEQSAALRALDKTLRDRYEGYDDEAGKWNRATPVEMIDELKYAVADDRLANEPITQQIKDYLDVRAAVIAKNQQWADEGITDSEISYQSAKEGAELRAVLVNYANELIAEDPGFQVVWERVFRQEIDNGIKVDDRG